MEALYRVFIYTRKYRIEIIGLFFTVSFLMGAIIYAKIYHLGFWDTTSYTLGLFAMDVKTPSEIADLTKGMDIAKQNWQWIFVASILAKITVIVGLLLIFFQEISTKIYRYYLLKNGNHSIVIGLGKNSRFFINSMIEQHPHRLIVFETDAKNPYIKQYKNKRMAIVIADIDNIMGELNLQKCANIFISTGEDRQNIYYALEFLKELPENKNHKKSTFNKMILHIENRTLRNLYADGNVLSSKKIDIRIFSFYKDAARILFEEHPLEGDDPEILKNNQAFFLNIVGNSELALSVVTEACRLAHYPHENRLIISCIDKNIRLLEQRVNYAFPEIKELERFNIYINYIELDDNEINFYKHPIWKRENIKHIVLCQDNIEENIAIATKLKNITYLRQERNAKIHIATMNHLKIANKMDEMNHQKNLFSFARADKVCGAENLLNNKLDNVATMIHNLYASRHMRENSNFKNIQTENQWYKASINDKRASTGQAIHMETKLRILGLKSIKDTKRESDKIYEHNQEIFNHKIKGYLDALKLDKKKLLEIEQSYRKKDTIKRVPYFIKAEKNLFEKLIEIEHKRWMAVNFLMDYQYDKNAKDKENRKRLKVHHLLKAFDKFETAYEQSHIINDINAILNIPLYLSQVGYKIEEL